MHLSVLSFSNCDSTLFPSNTTTKVYGSLPFCPFSFLFYRRRFSSIISRETRTFAGDNLKFGGSGVTSRFIGGTLKNLLLESRWISRRAFLFSGPTSMELWPGATRRSAFWRIEISTDEPSLVDKLKNFESCFFFSFHGSSCFLFFLSFSFCFLRCNQSRGPFLGPLFCSRRLRFEHWILLLETKMKIDIWMLGIRISVSFW